MQIVLTLPPCHPLRAVDVTCAQRVGVSDAKWRRWHASHEAGAAEQALPTPIVLMVGSGRHGHSWLLAGRPTATVRLHSLSSSLLQADDAEAARAAFGAALARHGDGSSDGGRHGATDGCVCAVAAVVLEPVCSQSGVVLTWAAASGLHAACAARGVPIVCDETRSG